MRKTGDALKILEGITGDDPELREMIAEETVNVRVAQLTQRQLADLIGSRQPVIARLEDADYEGHSLSMLDRIAAALGHSLHIQFVPKEKPEVQSA